ncbi:MAG: hypothetical protein NTW32_07850 [Chloroflexi bacterium]|nr:hypothetical protein [Chloroflexota bacterium]
MLASFTHILPLTTVVRKRILPCDGRILVKVGQKVDPADIVAEAIFGRRHLILNVARELGVSSRRAASLIKLKRGQKINQNEVIAETNGLFAREVIAPMDGRVVVIGGGKLVLEVGGSPIELLAGMQGVVTDIIPDRGVTIRATGSLIQGLWGNGLLDTGVMMSAMDRPDEAFDTTRLDVSVRSAIILGGYVENSTIFKIAADLPVRGLILSSMAPELIPLVSQLAYPVMLLEGFGRRPINPIAYKLLSTNIRRVINLNAASYDRLSGDRPEIFISLPVSQDPPEPRDVDTFNPGQIIRVISLTGPSQTGTLTRVSPSQTSLVNGLRVKTAEVTLDGGEKILVPLTNLEVLG